jgi:adenylate cyclase
VPSRASNRPGRRWFRSPWFRPVASLAIATIVVSLSALGLAVGAFSVERRQLGDRLFPSATRDPSIVIVAMDDPSLATLGRWPWHRSLHAQLIDAIESGNRSAIVYDVQFSEPSSAASQDLALAASIRSGGNVVLAGSGTTGPYVRGIPELTVFQGPIPVLAQAAASVAMTNVETTDGIVRSVPLVGSEADGTLLPTLALAGLRVSQRDASPFTVRPNGISTVDRFIPTDPRHVMTINLATSVFPVVSARDVLGGGLDPSMFDGKTVFVGATAFGLGDLFATPTHPGGGEPGVTIHAEALNTILTATYLVPESRRVDLLVIWALALLVAFAVLYLPVTLAAVTSATIAAVAVVVSIRRFDAGTQPDLLYPYIGIAISFLVALALRYVTEVRLRRQVDALFGQYVPPQVAGDLTGRDVKAALEGYHADVTVLFCDLRGFTSFTAKLEPHQVKEALDIYYLRASRLVQHHGGTLLQFVGDEVYAAWGAPVESSTHAADAFACAREIRSAQADVAADLAVIGLPPIEWGIGLNSGRVVAAHVGNELRRQYALVGDTVNVGARLCSAASAGQIVLSEFVLQRLPERPGDLEDMGAIPMKGVDRSIEVYRVPAAAKI